LEFRRVLFRSYQHSPRPFHIVGRAAVNLSADVPDVTCRSPQKNEPLLASSPVQSSSRLRKFQSDGSSRATMRSSPSSLLRSTISWGIGVSLLIEKNTLTRGVSSESGCCSITTPRRPLASRTSEPAG